MDQRSVLEDTKRGRYDACPSVVFDGLLDSSRRLRLFVKTNESPVDTLWIKELSRFRIWLLFENQQFIVFALSPQDDSQCCSNHNYQEKGKNYPPELALLWDLILSTSLLFLILLLFLTGSTNPCLVFSIQVSVLIANVIFTIWSRASNICDCFTSVTLVLFNRGVIVLLDQDHGALAIF